jgi:prephenate dehydratase
VARKVGYLGPPGTFGEQAALGYAPSDDILPQPSHTAVIAGVEAGTLDEGIAAIENSLEGAVNETVDALIQNSNVFIRRELVLPIEHCLIAPPSLSMQDIRLVLSHPSALGQCRGYLARELPNAQHEAALSTAAAVQAVMGMRGAAAIGTRRAAELSGGNVLAAGIQDVPRSKTRFVVLGREDAAPTGDDKTSLAFTVSHDRPGTLMGVLRELADRQINLTHIESRPSREDLGVYVFLIDFQGHRLDATVAEALQAVKAQAHYFRLFGSYPRYAEESGN